jgi:hypothetical protein
VAACFGGILSKARGGATPRDLSDASWLDGRARAVSEWFSDDGRLESKRQRDLVLKKRVARAYIGGKTWA